jgi:hypothetical protein
VGSSPAGRANTDCAHSHSGNAVSPIRAIALVLTFLAVAGCSSAAPSDAPALAPPVNARCLPAGIDIVGLLTAALTHHETVRNAYYVKSNEANHVLFVSADLEGTGLDGTDDIGTWATDINTGGNTFYEVNDLAAQSGGWVPGSVKGYSMSSDGASESFECATAAAHPEDLAPTPST